MSGRGTAGEQLERILYLLPLATREGGVSLAEAAERLGVTVETVQRDIEEVTARAFYHPAGGADEMQILLEPDRLDVRSHGKFERPVRLSRREMMALALGLRAAARELASDPTAARPAADARDLALRLEMELAVSGGRSGTDDPDALEIDPGDERGGWLRALFRQAVRDHRRYAIRYLKPGDEAPEDRELDPYEVVYGSGKWYVLGYCHLRSDVRAFRIDRMLDARALDATFEQPGDFDGSEYVTGGRVFHTEVTEEVVVRYSPLVAPWVREHGPVEELADGFVSVTFTAADPGWVVRHALGFGTEARVVSPPEVRELVVGAARVVLGAAG